MPVALVTGASRGLGAETARILARKGFSLGLMARSVDGLDAVAMQVRSMGANAVVLPVDITQAEAVSEAVDTLTRALGPADVLVNNAGMIDPIARVSDLSPADFDRALAVNLHGAFYCTRAVLPHMLAAGRGVVIQVSSGAAHRPLEGWTAYCVGKAGLWMMTRALAAEVGPTGIWVVGFQPGTVDTDMQARIRASGINPVSRMARSEHLPADVPAACLAWLAQHHPPEWHGLDLRVDRVRARMDAR